MWSRVDPPPRTVKADAPARDARCDVCGEHGSFGARTLAPGEVGRGGALYACPACGALYREGDPSTEGAERAEAAPAAEPSSGPFALLDEASARIEPVVAGAIESLDGLDSRVEPFVERTVDRVGAAAERVERWTQRAGERLSKLWREGSAGEADEEEDPEKAALLARFAELEAKQKRERSGEDDDEG